jgi:TatA/E family protein of Tat protein translocase
MPNIGPLEIVVILIIALIVFGPKRLPELGRSMGARSKAASARPRSCARRRLL